MTMRAFKIFVFCLLSTLGMNTAEAQFRQASIGINGLTCSQCSRSVEVQLRKLSFVQDVQMDLEHTEGKIIFKENKQVNINAVARAVKDAGFSVRYLKADISSEDIQLSEEGCFSLYGDAYYIVPPIALQDKGVLTLQFLGKDYAAKNELKQYKAPAQGQCKGRTVYVTTLSRN